MELTLNLDKIQSDNVSKYAKTILDKQNPYKNFKIENYKYCLLYTSPSPRDLSTSRMPSSA